MAVQAAIALRGDLSGLLQFLDANDLPAARKFAGQTEALPTRD
jgi:hypothetical protein